jgi:excisionase family DNA binding protein
VAQAARRYGITRTTAYRWIDKRVLPIMLVGPARRIRIPVAEADRVCGPPPV